MKKIFLFLLICLTLLNAKTAKANDTNIKNENIKTNVVDILTTESKMIYTYDENGKSYYMEENFNLEMTEINSDLYIVTNGEKVLEKTIKTYINQVNGDVKVYENGIQTINLSKDDYLSTSELKYDTNNISIASNGLVYSYDKYPQYNWYRQIGSGANLTFPNLTKAAITGIITGVLNASPATGIITGIATFFFEGGFRSGYYYKETYLNQDYNNNSSRPRNKIKTSFYTNSSRTKFIDATYQYVWVN